MPKPSHRTGLHSIEICLRERDRLALRSQGQTPLPTRVGLAALEMAPLWLRPRRPKISLPAME